VTELPPTKAPPAPKLGWQLVVLGLSFALSVAAWASARRGHLHALDSAQTQPSAPAASGREAPALPPESSAEPAPSAPAPSAEPAYVEADGGTLEEQKSALLTNLGRELALSAEQLSKVSAIVLGARWLGQGNPKVTRHPLTRAECRAIRKEKAPLPEGDPRCGARNMVPLYDPARGETAASARVCIDQYEFPNIACEYPVTWVRADEAVRLCQAIGKRICDAHEWEGACAGSLKPAAEEYAFGQRRMMIEYLHNKEREIVWSYGKTKDHTRCAMNSRKSPGCLTPTWQLCGSNTYPAGSFPDCRSPFGVYDLNGNAAEHMNLPLTAAELASQGGLGETEMKGSWFIFAREEAHLDDCRWRAPMWHHTRIDDPNSHFNYHLGFRCCRNLD
jgi:hypothetical protein